MGGGDGAEEEEGVGEGAGGEEEGVCGPVECVAFGVGLFACC